MTTWKYPIDLYDKQRQAVASKADEVLFGGSLAGGKTEAILKHMVDICLLVPTAKTLVIRKSFRQMTEIEQRLSTRIPPQVGKLNKSENAMFFYNGSQLRLGYLASEDDAENYQGHEYVKTGFDELTHYDESWVDRVNERLRAPQDIERRMDELGLTIGMLAASNPGSRGHAWVKERFIDPAPAGQMFESPSFDDQGDPELDSDGQPIMIRRQFIPSNLWDNPFINHDKYLRRLSGMDPERKRAMIYGDWSVPAGTRFPQFRERVHVIKPEDFPIPPVGVVRVVGVDYGINDPFAAVWAAKVGDTIVVYRDHVQDGLAASQQAAKVLELESEEERLHSDVTVALDPNGWARNPHFGGKKLSPGADEAPLGSIAYAFREALGDRVVKGWNPRIQGWAIFDELMVERDTGMVDDDGNPVKLPRILIYDTCRELIRGLSSAPRAKRDPQDIDTTWKHDHVCFVAGTMIATEHGPVPIERIRPGVRVWTRAGLREVTHAGMTSGAATVGDVALSSGAVLRGTADHPVFNADGVKARMDALRYGDRLIPWHTEQSPKNQSSTTGTPTPGGPTHPTGQTGSTTGAAADAATSTGTSTGTTTGQSRRAWWSTTRTTTRSTTTPRTLPLYTCPSTLRTIRSNGSRIVSTVLWLWNTWRGSARSLWRGTVPRKAGNGTVSTASRHTLSGNLNGSPASSVGPNTNPCTGASVSGSARTSASQRGVVRAAWTMLTATVRRVVSCSGSTSTVSNGAAPVYVVSSFDPLPGKQPVYNLTVDGEHEYYANGVLVSNCDAARYCLAELLGLSYNRPLSGHERLRLEGTNRSVTAGAQTVSF